MSEETKDVKKKAKTQIPKVDEERVSIEELLVEQEVSIRILKMFLKQAGSALVIVERQASEVRKMRLEARGEAGDG